MMRSQSALDGVRRPSDPGPLSRSSSLSTLDRAASPTSGSRYSMLSFMPPVHPPPAYLAAANASDIAEHNLMPSIQDDDDSEDAAATQSFSAPAFSEGALSMMNLFLDQLLFSFLGTARSSTLAALRPAVEHILKGRLARNAVASGDNEIADLLGGADDEDEKFIQKQEKDSTDQWDLETVWRRTRLRIMVYTSIGEMEGEDEERYLDEDRSRDGGYSNRSSGIARHVSWSAMIFLTSVLEYVAEQCVNSAGKAAYDRIAIQRASERPHTPDTGSEVLEQRPLVKMQDVEKLSLNSMLGKLWRTWRNHMRAGSRSSPRVGSATWSPLGTTLGEQSSNSNASERSTAEGMRPFWNNSLRIEGISDPKLLSEVSRRSLAVGEEAAFHELQRQQVPRRTRSANRFPVNVNTSRTASWQKRVARNHRPILDHRTRSRSLPTPRKDRFSALLDEARAQDPGEHLSGQPDSTAEDQRVRDEASQQYHEPSADVVGNEQTQGLSEAHNDGDQADLVDYQAAANKEEEKEQFADSVQDQDRKRPTSEYDPFRFDVPESAPKPKSPPGPVASQIKTAERTGQEEPLSSSVSTEKNRLTPKMEGAIASAVAGPAVLGSTTQARRPKKPDQLSVSTSGAQQSNPRAFGFPGADQPREAANDLARRPRQVVSPEEMTLNREAHHQALQHAKPSPLTNERKNTDESSSAYETPQGSPGNAVGEQKVADEKPTEGHQHVPSTSRVTRAVNPVSPRSVRSHSKGQKTSKSSIDSDRFSHTDTRSIQSEKEFSSLVSGGETLKRSLTPQNLREIEEPGSPRTRQNTVREEAHVPMTVNESEPADIEKPLRGNPTTNNESKISPVTATSPKRFVPRSPKDQQKPVLKSSRSGLTAREPRGNNDSTRDFADFIRSTAPDDEAAGRPAPIRPAEKPTPATALGSHRTSLGSPPAPRSTGNSPTISSPKDRVPPSTRSNKTKANKILYQPREARMESKGNRDLINFLNEGPPGVSLSHKPTEPGRTVERMSSANRSSSQTSNSFAESYNSRTGLLGKRNSTILKKEPMSPAEPPKPASTSTPMNSTGGPARKQRRIKDPYAIDDDDDDDDDDDLENVDTLTEIQPREESLVDFLKSAPPPSSVTGRAASSPKGLRSGNNNRPSFGTQSSAVGKPSNRNLSPEGGRPSRSTSLRMGVSPQDALPDFLRDSRADGASSQASSEADLNTPRNRNTLVRGASKGEGGVKSFFRRIGVNG